MMCLHQAATGNKCAKGKEVNEENGANYNAKRVGNVMPETLRKRPSAKSNEKG